MESHSNILQNPDDLRQWESLPGDVQTAVLSYLDKPSLAAVRLSCKAWSSSIGKCVTTLSLSSWPADPSVLAGFTSLTSISLLTTLTPEDAGRSAGAAPAASSSSNSSDSRSSRSRILALLTDLPRLSSLSLPADGGEDLPGLAALTGLTSITLVKPGLASASASGSTGGAVPDPDEADWLLPAAGAAAAPGGEAASERSSGERFAGSLPASLGGLAGLVSVALEGAGPDYHLLRQLQQLRRLELRGQTVVARGWSKVAANPLPGVGQLGAGLTALVARSNYGIKRLPPDVGALAGLAHLDVSKNMLFELPAELSRLTGLTLLDASSNCLTALPDCISCLTGLQHLDASNNSRVALPAALGRLSRLAHLALNWTWAEMGPLWQAASGLSSSLTSLSLIGNGISELPPAIGAFTALSQLCLSMNNLTTLPEEVGRLGRLLLLDAADNRLASLPPGLGRLSGLASLGLRSNCLAALPAEVAGLAGLTNLDVSMNQLAALPDGITCLTGLEQLALSMNPLGALPAGMASLRSLKILEMFYVKLAPGQQGGQGRAGGGPLPAEVADAAMDAARCLQAQLTQLYIFSNTLPGAGDEQDACDDGACEPLWDDGGEIARVLAMSAALLDGHDDDDDDDGRAADLRAEMEATEQRAAERAELSASFEAVLAAARRKLERRPADLSRLPSTSSSSSSSSGSSSPNTTSAAAAALRRYKLLHAAGGSSHAAAAASGGGDAESGGAGADLKPLQQLALPSSPGGDSPGSSPGSSRASSDGSWVTVDSSEEDEAGGGGSPTAASPTSHPISCSPDSGSSASSGRSSAFPSFCAAANAAAAAPGAAVGEAADRLPDLLPQGSISDLRKQQKQQQQQLLASLASSSSIGSSNWCQLRHTAGGSGASRSWPCLPAAAAAAADSSAAAGSGSSGAVLSGTWSCDLGMLAAAKAAANASAAGASAAGPVAGEPPLGNWAVGRAGSASAGGAAGGGGGRLAGSACAALRPLRPLSQAHSLGRPLLSRYSRGGEATGSPTISSGYGLPARLLAPTGSLAAADAAAEAPVPPKQQEAGAEAAGGSSISRPARRRTRFDDEYDAC